MKQLVLTASLLSLFSGMALADTVRITNSVFASTVAYKATSQLLSNKRIYFVKSPATASCAIYMTKSAFAAEENVMIAKKPVLGGIAVIEVKNPLLATDRVYVSTNPLISFGQCAYTAVLLTPPAQ